MNKWRNKDYDVEVKREMTSTKNVFDNAVIKSEITNKKRKKRRRNSDGSIALLSDYLSSPLS